MGQERATTPAARRRRDQPVGIDVTLSELETKLLMLASLRNVVASTADLAGRFDLEVTSRDLETAGNRLDAAIRQVRRARGQMIAAAIEPLEEEN